MKPLLSIFRTKPHAWDGCMPPTAAERMAQYSQWHAADMQARENAGVAAPRIRQINGRPVLVALDGRPNQLPRKSGH